MKLWILFLVCVVGSLGAQPRVMVFGAAEGPPLVDPSAPDGGLLVALNRAALRAVGWDLEVRLLPVLRVRLGVQDGSLDAFMMGNGDQPSDEFLVSDRTLNADIVVAVGPSVLWPNLEVGRLKGMTIGTVRGYGLERAFPDLTFEAATTSAASLQKLMAGRVPVILESRFTLAGLVRSLPAAGDQVRILEPPLMTMAVATEFSKKTADPEARLKDFNRGLKAIRASGEYDVIVRRYAEYRPAPPPGP